MTVHSQNGYIANQKSLITYWRTSGGVLLSSRRGSVTTVFKWLADRYNTEVQHLTQKRGCWGYAPRNIRGSSQVSNHASGTAIDLNAALHPLGTNPRANYTAKQIAAIHRVVADAGGVIRWGGDYHGRKDGMHFEINASPAAVKRLAKRIKAGGGIEEDDVKYASAGAGRKQKLPGGQWSKIRFYNPVAGGMLKKGQPSLIKGKCKYSVKYRLNISGIPEGEPYKVRIVEAKKAGGKWKHTDVAAKDDLRGTPGNDFVTMLSGPDTMAKGSRVWLYIRPAEGTNAVLDGCAAKGWYW